MTKKIIFCSGGTGGHMFPAIGLIKYFENKGYEVILVTDNRGSNFFKNNIQLKSYIIKADSPLKKNFLKKIFSILTIFISVLKSASILKKEKPDLVIGFGGYVSFPVSFSSRFYKIPLVIYENNSVLGRANKTLLPIAKKILLGNIIPTNFPEKYKSKINQVGNILREEIINYKVDKKSIIKSNFTILVLGGSQGAEIFGKIIPETIKMLKENGNEVKINQQCIKSQKDSLIEFYNLHNIKSNIFDFANNVLDLISSSDLAISRCGSSTISELVQIQTPFIAVPYPHSMDNHQYLNAKYYHEKGCCWILEQANFNSKNLFNLISNIMADEDKLKNVRERMKKNDSKEVYIKIEKAIKDFI